MSSTVLKEADRVMTICNACRYCEGFCAVFPAMELRRTFTGADLKYFANLCHNCRGCYYACQYAPPHGFDLNVPRVLGELRLETYREFSWPSALKGLFHNNGLIVPLIVEQKGTGIMGVVDPVGGRYDINRLSVFTTIAQQAAVAIENARHYRKATVDQLTDLYLRHHFMQRIADERTRSRRYRSPFALLMLDLDTFKEINDRHGHNTGDGFLRRVADAIKQNKRASDIACRWGGDEFCLLLPQAHVEEARRTAERIRKGIEALSSTVPGIRVTASVGIATYPNDFDGDLDELVRRADQALYRAKREGRDRVVVYSLQTGDAIAPASVPVPVNPKSG